ncbi:MAG: hypothetical protein U0Q16_31140 [Bryobacteraceae bacterium]
MRAPYLGIACAVAALAAPDPVRETFDHLYNFDFSQAHKTADAHLKASPGDPLGYSAKAAVDLFHELDRLKILQGEFFADDKKISGDDKLTADPEIRMRFYGSIEAAQKLADQNLASDATRTRALFSHALAEGMRMDYMAFIEKKQLRSLAAARRSQGYAVELLKRDPSFVDAYLTTGLTEYLVGSLPFFIRWFVKFDDTQGDKQRGVANLEKVAASGRYLGPFARILLSIINLREKNLPRTASLLEGLTQEYPKNSLLKGELEKVRVKLQRR